MTGDLIKQSLHYNKLQLDGSISGKPQFPRRCLLVLSLTISFQGIFSESDNGEVTQPHLFQALLWHTQHGSSVMKGFVLNMCTLGYGLVLTYGMKSLSHSAKAMLSLGLGSNGIFPAKKLYSNRLLIEVSAGLSSKVTRSQFSEIWVLWGSF